MGAVVLALASSFAFGVADFVGGLASRRLALLTVLAVSQLVGLAALALVLLARGVGPPDARFVPPAMIAALFGTLGLGALYRGLAVGAMSVVAPIAATGSVVPVLGGLALGESPSRLQNLGIVLALAGVVLASRSPGAQGGSRSRLVAGAGLAVAAAVCIGFFLVAVDAASEDDPYWATFVLRATSTTLLVTAGFVTRPAVRLARRDVLALSAVGLLDAMGNMLFAVATTTGLLGVVSVVTSLYPVTTVALARLLLGERIRRAQQAGVVSALAGVGLIGAG